jgi:HD-GYP domain-containing protein (c-di-GMP phosphodiesterase class II)/HAMP domain-containing protein
MSRSEGNRRAAGIPANGAQRGTMARKSIVAFSAMFIIPMLLAAYLFTRRTGPLGGDPRQLALLSVCVLVLGLGGFFLIRSVIHAMLRVARDASAIVEGDLDRRLDTEVEGEISELARNFNRITSRLQKTIDSLETSKGQIQTLLSQVCLTFGQNIDMAHMLEVFLKSLLSLTGLEMGAIFLLSPDGKELCVHASVGLREEERSTAILRGRGIVGWVAAHGQLVTTSESMPWSRAEGLTALEKGMPWAIHIPLSAHGKTHGVMSIGLGKGQREIAGDDLLMIQNLATQIAGALGNAELQENMEKTYVETVSALATAVEARDNYTRGHSRRVTECSMEIARRMELPEAFVRDLEAAALLHDIGKIGIPDHILHNNGELPPDGLRFILEHPIGGENILKPVGSLSRLCPIVRHHHERYDGEGYPDRLKGEEIPLAARILSVADSYDAMISDRAYKPTRTKPQAIAELLACKGGQFDPECVDVFIAYLRENPEAGVLCPA